MVLNFMFTEIVTNKTWDKCQTKYNNCGDDISWLNFYPDKGGHVLFPRDGCKVVRNTRLHKTSNCITKSIKYLMKQVQSTQKLRRLGTPLPAILNLYNIDVKKVIQLGLDLKKK